MRSGASAVVSLSRDEPRAFILGGNANTLAFVTSLRADAASIQAQLVPIAQTPLGTVIGDSRQNVTLALENLLDWLDQTFPAGDEHSFIAPVRDIELLARINWTAEPPSQLDDRSVLNIEDVPDEIAEALAHPAQSVVQCSSCRRLCVRDHFAWKERQLCAWDYHRQAFGKRAAWRNDPYEQRHFEALPAVAYVAPPLLEEAGVDVILGIAGVEGQVALESINLILASDGARAHMAVRTPDGYTLLRERPA